jgi:hypothetical protein
MITSVWSKDRIIDEFRKSKRGFVIKRISGEIHDVGKETLARLEGDYQVEETPHEIIIVDKFKARKPLNS